MNLTQFQLTYELCPIILQGGIADKLPGSQLPVISLTQAQDFTGGVLLSSDQLSAEDFIAHFIPMSGATMVDNQVGQYPFANQYVAANAMILQPLRLSMMMIAPAPTQGGYPQKLAAFSSLHQQLIKHTILGGTYIVATPAMYYTDMLLTSLRDVSTGESKQVQVQWQWDFIQPLLTEAAATQAYNGLTSKLSSRLPTPDDPISYSGPANAVGMSGSGVASAIVPGGRQAGGSSVLSAGVPATAPGVSGS